MTRSRVWQKSLFSSNSNSGCDNVFGDDPKPMHQSCWLVDKKAFSVLHVSHFEFYFLFFSPLMSVEVWFMFCLFEGIALCVNIPVLDVWKWVIQHVMLEKCDGVLPDFRICLASLSYIIMYSKDTWFNTVSHKYMCAYCSLIFLVSFQWIKVLPIKILHIILDDIL